MSAIDTATRVIEWTMIEDAGQGPPPQGDVHAIEQLARPPASLRQTLGQLTALTAARLRFGTPPLGDNGTVGLGGLLIAAAIGMANVPEAARIVLDAVPRSASPIDWVARHGVVSRALRFLPEAMADDCRHKSPLTSLLNHPMKTEEADTWQDVEPMEVARQLLGHPAERLSLTLHLARPTGDAEVRRWRHHLLDRLRFGTERHRSFVLDVYEAMMIHHQQEAIDQVRRARTVMLDPIASANERILRDALSVAQWWGPLWALERADVHALRTRRYLDYEYRKGIALFKLARKLTGGSLS